MLLKAVPLALWVLAFTFQTQSLPQSAFAPLQDFSTDCPEGHLARCERVDGVYNGKPCTPVEPDGMSAVPEYQWKCVAMPIPQPAVEGQSCEDRQDGDGCDGDDEEGEESAGTF